MNLNQETLTAALAAYGVPSHDWEDLAEYIFRGRPTDSFLEAVLSNDLAEAVRRADNVNFRSLARIVAFLDGVAPVGCWGSQDRVLAWRATRGLAAEPGRPAVPSDV